MCCGEDVLCVVVCVVVSVVVNDVLCFAVSVVVSGVLNITIRKANKVRLDLRKYVSSVIK